MPLFCVQTSSAFLIAFRLLGLALGTRFLACEIGVVELHHGVIKLASLLLIGIAGSDEFCDCILQRLAGVGEPVCFFRPALAFFLPRNRLR